MPSPLARTHFLYRNEISGPLFLYVMYFTRIPLALSGGSFDAQRKGLAESEAGDFEWFIRLHVNTICLIRLFEPGVFQPHSRLHPPPTQTHTHTLIFVGVLTFFPFLSVPAFLYISVFVCLSASVSLLSLSVNPFLDATGFLSHEWIFLSLLFSVLCSLLPSQKFLLYTHCSLFLNLPSFSVLT